MSRLQAYSVLRLESVASHVGKGPKRLFLSNWLKDHNVNRHIFKPSRHAQGALYSIE